MARKRVTQVFPFLLPLRLWQRKKCFYMKMRISGEKWAGEISPLILPCKVCEYSSVMVNEKSGFDIKYQINKVHNLKLAAAKLNRLIIRPGESFSFWRAVRNADRKTPYKDGLEFIDGKIQGSYGGGLCHLSNLLFWLLLHTPLEITERHGHSVESFPSASEELPCGTDATINEGWLDLRAKNNTMNTYQIVIDFDDEKGCIIGRILSSREPEFKYEIFNGEKRYFKKEGKTFLSCTVDCVKTNRKSGDKQRVLLYQNLCEIGYALPDNTVYG